LKVTNSLETYTYTLRLLYLSIWKSFVVKVFCSFKWFQQYILLPNFVHI